MPDTLNHDQKELGKKLRDQVNKGTIKCILILFVIIPVWSALLMYLLIFLLYAKVIFIIVEVLIAIYLFYRMAKIYYTAYTCPQCKKLYNFNGFSNVVFTKKCVNCGLEFFKEK